MRSLFKIVIFVLIAIASVECMAQEPVKNDKGVPENQANSVKKGQNNNTVRSNRTDNKTVVDQPNSGNAATAKKGYDYYKAKSDMNQAKTSNASASGSASKTSTDKQNP